MGALTTRYAARLLMAAAVAVAVLDGGGFDPGPRVVFACLAAAALLVTTAFSSQRVGAATLQPAVLALLLLGMLGAASALWTIGDSGSAVRWGMVTAAYGAVAICAAVLFDEERGAVDLAALIALLAIVTSVIGIVAAVRFRGPYAEYASGFWEPGGTLEYAPALSLLAVSALPLLLTAMCSDRWWASLLSTAGAAVCSTAIALSHSRAEVALAICVGLFAVWRPRQTVRASRARTLLALAVLTLQAAAAYAVAGTHVGETAQPDPSTALPFLALTVGCAGALWLLLRRACSRITSGASSAAIGRAVPVCGGAACLAAACVLLASPGGKTSGPIPHPGNGGFTHGRLHLWQTSLEVAEQRPLYGFGADTFLEATLAKQDQTQAPVRYAHDLPIETAVELGIPGALIVVALYVAVAHAWWRRRAGPGAWLLGPGALAFLLASLIDWPWHLAGSGAVWAAALGGLLAQSAPGRRPEATADQSASVPSVDTPVMG